MVFVSPIVQDSPPFGAVTLMSGVSTSVNARSERSLFPVTLFKTRM